MAIFRRAAGRRCLVMYLGHIHIQTCTEGRELLAPRADRAGPGQRRISGLETAPGIQRGKHRVWRLRPRLRDCPKSARKLEPRPLSASAPRHPSRALHCAIPCLGHDGIVLAGAVTSRSRGPSGPSGPSGPTAVLLPLQHAGRGPGRRRTQPRHAFITFYYSCFGREGSLLRFSSRPYLALPRPAALRVPLSPLLSEIVHIGVSNARYRPAWREGATRGDARHEGGRRTAASNTPHGEKATGDLGAEVAVFTERADVKRDPLRGDRGVSSTPLSAAARPRGAEGFYASLDSQNPL